jgi:hypothetical protein
VCKGILHHINECLVNKDNHDSWGMCKTSIECRAVMTAVLMVMSDMDPHTITGLVWLGSQESVSLVL